MPNQPRTPGRMFRIDPELYAAAKAVAAARGETLTHVVTDALRRYVRRNAELSAPPAKEHP